MVFERPQIEMVSGVAHTTIDDRVTKAAYWSEPRLGSSAVPPAPRDEIVLELSPRRAAWAELLQALAMLEVRGATIDWAGFDHGYVRRKVELPTYPFQRERYWVDAPDIASPAPLQALRQDWLYEAGWEIDTAASGPSGGNAGSWLVLGDADGVGAELASALQHAGGTCVVRGRDDRDADLGSSAPGTSRGCVPLGRGAVFGKRVA